MDAMQVDQQSVPEWRIEIADVAFFKNIVDAVAAVTMRAVFKLTKLGIEGWDLTVDTRDPGFTCFVHARLRLEDVQIHKSAGEATEFVMQMACNHLAVCLDDPTCVHGELVMSGTKDRVHVVVQNKENPSYKVEADLPTYVDDFDNDQLQDIEFDYTVEVDVSQMKSIIKKAQKAKAEELEIGIALSPGDSMLVQSSMVQFVVRGELTLAATFQKETHTDETGTIVCRADGQSFTPNAISMGQMNKVYTGTFPVEKINAFLKALPAKNVTMRVKKDMPLVMIHKHPGETDKVSRIHFLVAPISQGDF